MGLIDQLKSAGEQATASARETLHESQLRHELSLAYVELGLTARGLLEQGALHDPRLVPGVERVRGLERELAALTLTARDSPRGVPEPRPSPSPVPPGDES